MRPPKNRLPYLPPKRNSQLVPSQLTLYKTQSSNPYKAVVSQNDTSKEEVPTSKYIGIHHCSIEFNAAALKTSMQVAASPNEMRNSHMNNMFIKSVEISPSKKRQYRTNYPNGSGRESPKRKILKRKKSTDGKSSGSSCHIDSIKDMREALVNGDLDETINSTDYVGNYFMQKTN